MAGDHSATQNNYAEEIRMSRKTQATARPPKSETPEAHTAAAGAEHPVSSPSGNCAGTTPPPPEVVSAHLSNTLRCEIERRSLALKGGRAAPPLTTARKSRGRFFGPWDTPWALVTDVIAVSAIFVLLFVSLVLGAAIQ